MIESEILESIEESEYLDRIAEPLQKAVDTIFPGTERGRAVEDVLHGKWMGHPLHPALTDLPIGAWTAALAMDMMEATGRKEVGPGADAAISIGLVGALGAALAGLVDWQYTIDRPRRVGVAHALANGTATLLYGASLLLRRRGQRAAGRALSTLGFGAVTAGAYLGGELMMREHIGPNHATMTEPPEGWVAVLPESSLAEGEPVRAMAGDTPVLLVKRNKWISAIAATCSHMGGPLDEGTLNGNCVTCPWHGSVFCLDDGAVVQGPATYPQPVFEVRVLEGQVQVRPAR